MPYVNDDHKILYVRVPRTGSTSVALTFPWHRKAMPVHLAASEIRQTDRERYRGYTWIAAVRHPYAWIPSFHYWLQAHPIYEQFFYTTNPNAEGWVSFIEHLRWTPCDWIECDLPVTVYRVEDGHPFEDILGAKFPRLNEESNLAPFELTPEIEEAVRRKFWREMKFYE